MNNKGNCQNRREAITALVLGILDTKDADELQRHIESCQSCRKLYQELFNEEESIRSAFKVIAERDEMLQSSLIEQFDKGEQTAVKRNKETGKTIKLIWRTIMKNPITKFAAAAAIIIAVLTVVFQFGGSMESLAFAEAVRPVLDARTASFDVALESGNQPVQMSHFLCMSPGLVRQTMSDGTINIADYQQNKAISLNPKEKMPERNGGKNGEQNRRRQPVAVGDLERNNRHESDQRHVWRQDLSFRQTRIPRSTRSVGRGVRRRYGPHAGHLRRTDRGALELHPLPAQKVPG